MELLEGLREALARLDASGRADEDLRQFKTELEELADQLEGGNE